MFTENMAEYTGIFPRSTHVILCPGKSAMGKTLDTRLHTHLLGIELDWHLHLGSVKIAIVGATKVNVPP